MTLGFAMSLGQVSSLNLLEYVEYPVDNRYLYCFCVVEVECHDKNPLCLLFFIFIFEFKMFKQRKYLEIYSFLYKFF